MVNKGAGAGTHGAVFTIKSVHVMAQSDQKTDFIIRLLQNQVVVDQADRGGFYNHPEVVFCN